MAVPVAPSPPLDPLLDAGFVADQERPDERERVELELLLEAIYRYRALDFRGYRPMSVRRRLWRRARAEGLSTLSALQERVLHDPACMERLLTDLSLSVTAMFRDPEFFAALRARVLPRLAAAATIRVWVAGCATGEEAWSMAILLEEAGLYDRARIYATDLHEGVLERAQTGICGLERMREYTANYQRSGGTRAFSEYYAARGTIAAMDRHLGRNIVFAQHNLASDGRLHEFDLILCRNVMIYFAPTLQRRVHTLLHDSLVRSGVLGLGARESIRFSGHDDDYIVLDESNRLYRSVRS